jgi:hypothetical protein
MKKVPRVFLKIASTYQSTPKILYVLKGTKEEPKREPKLPSLVLEEFAFHTRPYSNASVGRATG